MGQMNKINHLRRIDMSSQACVLTTDPTRRPAIIAPGMEPQGRY